MKWFKFYGAEFLSDPKMIALTAAEKSCWVTLLCLASINDNGVITHITEDRLRVISGLNPTESDWENTSGMLEKFKKLDMITNDNEMITILNWQKRQETNLTGYERVKRYREKKRNDNAMITIDKNRRDNILSQDSSSSPKYTVEEDNQKEKGVLPLYKDLIKWSEDRRGFPFLRPLSKQYSAFKLARTNKIQPEQLMERWKELENQKKDFDWMTVVYSFNRKK